MSAFHRPTYPRSDTDISLQDRGTASDSKDAQFVSLDGKDSAYVDENAVPAYDNDDVQVGVVHDAKDLITTVISVEDDPTLNPWVRANPIAVS